MKFKSILMAMLFFGLIFSCKSDDNSESGNGNEEPTAAVDNITIEMQHIITPVDGQPAARYMKYNMLGGDIYFQELSGTPQNGDAYLWTYSVPANDFTLKYARGTSFSWAGWGTKLFNLNGRMTHIDRTSEPYAEYFGNDIWMNIPTNIPAHIVDTDVAVSGQRAYFLGGEFSNTFNSFMADGSWQNLAPFPINIENPALVADDTHVYALGGREVENGTAQANYFARYSIEDNQWETLQNVPHPTTGTNYGNKAIIDNNRFLVVLTTGENQQLLDIYDIEENIWKTEPLNIQYPVSYMYEFNDALYFIEESYSEATETITCKLYKAILDSSPN